MTGSLYPQDNQTKGAAPFPTVAHFGEADQGSGEGDQDSPERAGRGEGGFKSILTALITHTGNGGHIQKDSDFCRCQDEGKG